MNATTVEELYDGENGEVEDTTDSQLGSIYPDLGEQSPFSQQLGYSQLLQNAAVANSLSASLAGWADPLSQQRQQLSRLALARIRGEEYNDDMATAAAAASLLGQGSVGFGLGWPSSQLAALAFERRAAAALSTYGGAVAASQLSTTAALQAHREALGLNAAQLDPEQVITIEDTTSDEDAPPRTKSEEKESKKRKFDATQQESDPSNANESMDEAKRRHDPEGPGDPASKAQLGSAAEAVSEERVCASDSDEKMRSDKDTFRRRNPNDQHDGKPTQKNSAKESRNTIRDDHDRERSLKSTPKTQGRQKWVKTLEREIGMEGSRGDEGWDRRGHEIGNVDDQHRRSPFPPSHRRGPDERYRFPEARRDVRLRQSPVERWGSGSLRGREPHRGPGQQAQRASEARGHHEVHGGFEMYRNPRHPQEENRNRHASTRRSQSSPTEGGGLLPTAGIDASERVFSPLIGAFARGWLTGETPQMEFDGRFQKFASRIHHILTRKGQDGGGSDVAVVTQRHIDQLAGELVKDRQYAVRKAVHSTLKECQLRHDHLMKERNMREKRALKEEKKQLNSKALEAANVNREKDMVIEDLKKRHKREIAKLKERMTEERRNQARSLNAYMKASVHSLRLMRKSHASCPSSVPEKECVSSNVVMSE